MSLELISWNPRKKRRKSKARTSKKSRGLFGGARKRRRRARRKNAPGSGAIKGGPTMAKKSRKRRSRRRSARKFTAHTSPCCSIGPLRPPPRGRRRRSGGGGGFSLRSAFNVGAIIEGTIVGASVAGSGILTNKIVAKVKPDLAANPWLMSAAQIVLGVAGQAALKMLGMGKYAGSWMTGSVAGATLNAYGAWQAHRASGGQQTAQTMSGMRGLAGTFGPVNSPGFTPAGVSRNAYSAA